MQAYKQAKTQPDLIAYVVDPGWVKTGELSRRYFKAMEADRDVDMGGPNAMMEPEESVARLIKLATTATTKSSGKFFRHDGEEIPW